MDSLFPFLQGLAPLQHVGLSRRTVIYYLFDAQGPLYALLVYGKNEQGNLTPEQKKYVTTIAGAVKAEAKKKRKRG